MRAHHSCCLAFASLGLLSACGSDGSGKTAPPTQSNTVAVPFQITTVYALEQKGDTDPIARARYYDVTQVLDVWGNAGRRRSVAGPCAGARRGRWSLCHGVGLFA